MLFLSLLTVMTADGSLCVAIHHLPATGLTARLLISPHTTGYEYDHFEAMLRGVSQLLSDELRRNVDTVESRRNGPQLSMCHDDDECNYL